ncbi:MAG: type II secretion system protein [Silvibacterium sp.]
MTSSPQGRTNSEAGYILLAVLFLVALILLSLAVAAPRIAKSIQRDKELELIHRGEQYKRAIKLYYRKFGSYPASIDQLENTNNIRFLRKRYTDPMTGKDDWKIIHFGQAHVQTLGLFGQPIATAGGGPGGVAGGIGTGGIGAATGGLGSAGTPLTGSGSITAPTTGGTNGSGTSGTDGSGSKGGSTSGSGTGGLGTGGLGTGGLGTGGLGTTGTGGLSAGGLGTGTTGNTNPTFGGGPIVGIAIPSTKASIKEYKQQKHYNEWEFVYDPAADQMQAGTLFGGATQNLNGQGTTNGTSGTFGSGLGNTTGAEGATTPTGGTGSGAGSPTPQQ